MKIGFCAVRKAGGALLLVTVSVAGLLGVNPIAWGAEHWKAYTYNAAATVTAVKGLNALFSQIDKDTNAQLQIRLNLGGTLSIAATDITEAVASNVVQLGDDAFFVGSVPVGGIVRLPMFIRSRAEFEKAWSAEEPYLKAAYAKKDVVLLGHYVFPYNVLWSRKKTTTLADIAGQKIRVISPEQAEFIKRLGAIPVTLGTSEVAAALDRGVIDGVLTASSGYGYIWRDLLKYRYSLDVSFIDSLLLVNKDAWDGLSPENRAKVQAATDQATRNITTAMATEEDTLTNQLASKGIVVTTPTPADLATAEKLITPYWDGWAKARGGDAAAAMQKVRAAIGR